MKTNKEKKLVKICLNPTKNVNCLIKQFYSNKYDLKYALEKNKLCRSCALIGRKVIWGDKISEYRIGKTYEELYGKEKAKEIRKKQSEFRKGIPRSVETRKRIGESRKGQTPWNEGLTKYDNPKLARSTDVRKKISETRIKLGVAKGDNNPSKRPEVRKKQRLAALKRNGIKCPNHNPEACKIIDEYSKKYGFNFRHAENGGEICIDGYWPDGLDEKRKTIIEIDESHHFSSDGKLKEKDVKRQKYLEGLGYRVIRIKI